MIQVVKGEELERTLKSLSEKLTSAITESTAKDDLLTKHIKVAEEALEGYLHIFILFLPQ